jgi:hypothetical protein
MYLTRKFRVLQGNIAHENRNPGDCTIEIQNTLYENPISRRIGIPILITKMHSKSEK